MDLLGHLTVIEEAGLASGEALWHDGAVLALFPNLAHCHDWAYDSLWHAHREPDRARRIVQGHMICDWVIHYGDRRTPTRERIGWAYQQMPRALDRLDAFMDHVTARGFAPVDPRALDDRAHLERDFAHTAVECAVDVHVTERHGGRVRLDAVCRALAPLATPEGRRRIDDILGEIGGRTAEPVTVLDRTAEEFGTWAASVERPTDFAALTLCSKYGLEVSPESVADVSSFVADIAGDLDPSSTARMFDTIVERIADPERALR